MPEPNSMRILMRKIRVALTPRAALLKARLANGALVWGENRPGFGGRGVYVYRDSVEPELEHLEEFLEPGGVLIDVGAATGVYTLKAAAYYASRGGGVVAVEPFAGALAALFRGIRANGFTNVRVYHGCAGERTGPATLWLNFSRPDCFGLVRRDAHASGRPTRTVALDDLRAWEPWPRLDYVKIDVEGAEEQVLRGARRTIAQDRPIVQREGREGPSPPELEGYAAFRAPRSINTVYVPREHPKIGLAGRLGWARTG